MALMMQERQSRGVNWFALFVFAFLLLVVVGGGGLLFFGPTPLIEVALPTELAKTTKISEATLDPAKIVNNPVLQGFRAYGTAPSIGTVGRQNPFIDF